MSKLCSNCQQELFRSTKGDRCRNCFRNRNNIQSSQIEDEDEISSIQQPSWGLEISDEIIRQLPELPDEWYKKDVNDLNTGHLVRIMMGIFQPLHKEILNLQTKANELETKHEKTSTTISQNIDNIKDLENDVKHKKGEINLLKRAIYNQQTFLENAQKRESRNNLIITGIPNNDMAHEDATFHTSYEKVMVILCEVCGNISAESYEVIVFPPAENRQTHVCKVVIRDYKIMAMKNVKKLKHIKTLESVFLQWD